MKIGYTALVDYSSAFLIHGASKVTHAKSIDIDHFKRFLKDTLSFDFDIML